MKLIKPSVELWSEENVTPEQHIARCARVCYGHEGEGKDPKKLCSTLARSGHVSMFRHASKYVHIKHGYFNKIDLDMFEVNPYLCLKKVTDGVIFSTNMQHWQMYGDKKEKDAITPEEVLHLCKSNSNLFSLYRLTFCLTTQISTSRELNRVSPNNIAERSTRYCSSKDGLEICQPWWFDNTYMYAKKDDTPQQTNDRIFQHKVYIEAMEDAEHAYQRLSSVVNMKPQDARGVLPLDTATKVVYTYSVEEWQHILDLRYYEHTGKAHPNAKLIMGMVRDQINDFAFDHNIDYHV